METIQHFTVTLNLTFNLCPNLLRDIKNPSNKMGGMGGKGL